MKRMRNPIIIAIVLFTGISLTSCRKSYTCTCDTVQSNGASETMTYDLNKQTYEDAKDFCERYEDDLNLAKEGTSGCHI